MNLRIGDCVVRDVVAADRTAIVKHANNPRVARMLSDRFPSPYTEVDAKRWLAFLREEDPLTHFAIATDEEVIGGVGLEPRKDVYRHSAGIGYWLGEAHWGRGIATRVVEAMTEWGFRELGLVRIYASVFESNPASARVLEKAGYVLEARLRKGILKEGVLLDELVYGVLREDAAVPSSSGAHSKR
jgi:RimJ/RimL family protein N-acetyltransferase